MAINVTQAPNTNCSANDPIVWKFQFTALGTPPVKKSMTYYLADSGGTRISEIYVWTPEATSEICTFDAASIVRSLVSTSFPNLAGIQTDSLAVIGIKVKYTESDFDTSTCIDSPGSETSTGTVYAWNTALNFNTISDFIFTGGKTGTLMNSYPTRMYWGSDNLPFMWFAGAGSIQITWYSSSGASLGTITYTLTSATTSKYINLDYAYHGITIKPSSARIIVNNGSTSKTYTASYDVCTCRDFFTGFMFLDPLGGRSFASVSCKIESSVSRSNQDVVMYNPTSITKGLSALNPSSNEQYKLTIPLGRTNEDKEFAIA